MQQLKNYFFILQENYKLNIKVEKCPAYHDHRGDLIQFITQQNLQDRSLVFGQVYLLTFQNKNTVRGNHYHNHSSEIFCLISGSVEMIFENIETCERIHKIFKSEENEYYRIYVGEKTAHAIKSISDFAVMVSFSSKEYDLNDNDKIVYQLF